MTDRSWMSPVDGAWLRMDSPTNPMVINAVLRLDGAVPHSEVEALLRDRLLSHARFRRRVVPSPAPLVPARWEEDPDLRLDWHLRRSTLPAGAGDSALEELVSELVSEPLDRTRPLWQIYHVEGLDSGSVLVARVHHAVGDGVALVKLLLRLTDGESAPAPPKVGVAQPRARGPVRIAKLAAAKAVSLGRMLLLPADPTGPLKGPLGAHKKVAWSRPFDVAALKKTAHARSAKLNDVVVASVSGALRAYLSDRGAPQDSVRALVPVYVRGEETGGDMGNHFGLVYLPLPVGLDGIEERIREAKRAMDDLKRAPDALAAVTVLAAMGMASSGLQRVGIDLFTRKASLLLSNVPGPTEPLRLLGRQISSVLVWAPVSGEVAVGVTLLSYAGAMRMGVSTDAAVVPDPQAIVAAFEREMEATLSL